MPVIPAQSLPQVAPSDVTPVFQRVDARADAFGATVAQAGSQLARSIGGASDDLAQNAIRFQQIQNETEVNDAYTNGFSPQFRDLYQKYYALQGKDALVQYQPFHDQMQTLREDVRSNLKSDVQRKLFDTVSRRRVEMELDGMARYADQQNKVWRQQTFTASLKNLRTDAADKWNDEAAFGTALGTGFAEIDRYAAQTGASAEMARQWATDFESDAFTDRIERMSLTNPIAARDLYRANIARIAGPQRVILEHKLRAAVLPVEAKNAADQVMAGRAAPQIETALTVAGEPLISAIVAQESGGKQSAVSPKGAIGVMQVMPDTAREVAGEMGLEYNPDKLKGDAAYNKALGTRYFNNMLARYGGNQTLALAAYNAGPGRVDGWIKTNGDPNKGEISDADWAAKIPFNETRDYVANVNAKAGEQSVARMSSKDTRANLGTWMSEGERMAESLHPGDPVFRDMVAQNIRGYANKLVAAQEGVQKQAHSSLMKVIVDQKPMTLDELLASPEAKSAWEITDPSSQRGLIAAVEHNARAANGTPVRTNPATFQEIFRRIHLDDTDPNKIRQPGQLAPFFMKDLNRTDYDWAVKEIERNQTSDGQRLNETRNRFLDGVKGQFTKSTIMLRDGKGDEDYYKFQTYVLERERQAREGGDNPYELFNPKSPKYLSNDIPAFQRSLEQRLRDFSAGMKPAAKPLPPEQQRRPGETAADYLKRTGAAS